MREIAITALLAALDEALAGAAEDGAPLLAFDADGTLWSGDVGDDLFDAMIEDDASILPPAARGLIDEARALAAPHALDARSGADAARAIAAAYRAGAYVEERFYELVAWMGAGRTATELAALAHHVQSTRNLDARLHAEVRPVLAWARDRGVEVFVVSASPRAAVVQGVARVGVAAERVLASEAEMGEDGRMLARARRPIPYAAGKVRALRARVGERPILAAFGDNVFDLAMLQAARVAVAVRPKDRLVAREREIPNCACLAPA